MRNKQKDYSPFFDKKESHRRYYKRKDDKLLELTDNKQMEFYSEIRYRFIFYTDKSIREDMLKLLRKYKSNISLSCLLIDMKKIKDMNSSDERRGREKRETMNDYIATIIKTLNREWGIHKLLKED